MNIVILCKSWNHKKVIEIVQALHAQALRVRGIVALAAPSQRITLARVVHKVNEQGLASLFSHFFSNRFGRHEHLYEFVANNGVHPPADLQSRHGPLHITKNHQPPRLLAEYAQQQQIEMVCVQDLNSVACVTALQQMRTEILLFGGVPIIRANILAVPKVCTLNVHMALLPEFRGMNVAEWSIFNGAPVGVTVHQVDPGVDTGAILYRETIAVSDCNTIAAMRAKVSRQQHLVLAKCTRLLVENRLSPIPQKKSAGKQFYLMHEKLKNIVERQLAKGYQNNSAC